MKRNPTRLAFTPRTPTLREVRREIADIINQELMSYREADGVIREWSAIQRITAARRILELLPKRNPSTGKL